MQTIKLDTKTLEGLARRAAARTEYRDALAPGLRVRVSPEGHPRFSYCYSFRQGARVKNVRLRLGHFPQVSLAEARKRAADYTDEIDKGGRPMNAGGGRRAKSLTVAPGKAAPARASRLDIADLGPFLPGSFGALARLYIETHLPKKREKGRRDDVTKLRGYLIPYWRDVPMALLSREMITQRLDEIAARGSESDYMRAMRKAGKRHKAKPAPVMADRVGALVSKMCTFAFRKGGWFPKNQPPPALLLERYAKKRQGGHYLKRAEVAKFWQACQAETEAPLVAGALWFELLTGQRGGEILGMAWRELDLDDAWWTIPGERTKNGRVHRVPLTPAALAVLREIQRRALSATWVFPHFGQRNRKAAAPGPMTHETRSYRKASARIREAVGGFKPHDLRRTVNTHCIRLKVPEAHCEELLNHTRPGVNRQHYNEYEYDVEKREALDVWDRELRTWLAIPAAPKVEAGRLLQFPAAA
jgi:integrase